MSGSVIIDAKVKMKRERDKTMKILGLSFGKKNANCDILTKEALYGAREAYPDAEIKFINTQRLNIGRCIGCGACENLCPSRPFSAIYVEGHVMHRTV